MPSGFSMRVAPARPWAGPACAGAAPSPPPPTRRPGSPTRSPAARPPQSADVWRSLSSLVRRGGGDEVTSDRPPSTILGEKAHPPDGPLLPRRTPNSAWDFVGRLHHVPTRLARPRF